MKSVIRVAYLLGTMLMVSLTSCMKESAKELKPTQTTPGITRPTPGINCSKTNRTEIQAQLIPVGALSVSRAALAIASNGNKLLLAGGFDPSSLQPSSRVDIYDLKSTKWSTAELAVPRYDIGAASSENIIIFAGGYNGDDILGKTYSTVDVYDALANTWSVGSMSNPMGGRAAVVLENKIFLAGGNQCSTIPCTANYPPVIDIFDAGSNTWSTTQLSEGREGLSAVSAGGNLYFAGGLNKEHFNTNLIDIYDGLDASWSYDKLIHARANMAGISIGDAIFFAGGAVQNGQISDLVDIIDVNTQTASKACLFQPNAWFTAVQKNNLVIFFTGAEWVPNLKNKFDIYDWTTNTWSIGVLNHHIAGASIISVNNIIYVAGGYVNGVLSKQVWKLEF